MMVGEHHRGHHYMVNVEFLSMGRGLASKVILLGCGSAYLARIE